jgi:hypothetical protein
MPVTLTDLQLEMIFDGAASIAWRDRANYLVAIADALPAESVPTNSDVRAAIAKAQSEFFR